MKWIIVFYQVFVTIPDGETIKFAETSITENYRLNLSSQWEVDIWNKMRSKNKAIDKNFQSNQNDIRDNNNQIESPLTFDYKLIGYRAGSNNSSVILKKGNKEYVVSKGEKLEGVYELIEVSKDEVVFRKDKKLYKIENRLVIK